MCIIVVAQLPSIRVANCFENPFFGDLTLFQHVTGMGSEDVFGHHVLEFQFTTIECLCYMDEIGEDLIFVHHTERNSWLTLFPVLKYVWMQRRIFCHAVMIPGGTTLHIHGAIPPTGNAFTV
jgi:hypothetical protein